MTTTNILLAVVNLFILAILARLIEPVYFGVYATFIVLTTIISTFTDSFLCKNLLIEKLSVSVFQASIAITLFHSFLIALLLYNISDYIQSFFNNVNDFDKFLRVGVWVIPITSISNILTSYYEKKLRFKWLSIRKFGVNIIASGLVTITLAYVFNLNQWALLVGLYIRDLLNIIFMLFALNKAKVNFNSEHIKIAYLDIYTIISTNLLNKFALHGDQFIISKFLGGELVGLYNKAYLTTTAPIKMLNTALQKVGISTLANFKDDNEIILDIYNKLIYFVGIISIPISIIVFYLSDEIILLLFGDKWLGSAGVLQILTLGLFFRLAYKIPGTILQVRRKFNSLLKIQFFYSVMIIGFSFIFVKQGIVGVSIGVLISIILNFLVMSTVMLRVLEYRPIVFMKAMKYPIINTLIGIFAVQVFDIMFNHVSEFNAFVKFTFIPFYAIVFILFYLINKKIFFGDNFAWWMKKLFNG